MRKRRKKQRQPKTRIFPDSQKSPKSSYKPKPKKQPKTSIENIPKSLKEKSPVWVFSKIDIYGKWGWINLDRHTLTQVILRKIKKFETMKWGEIQKQRSKHHSMPVANICSDAQKRLKEIGIFDIDELFSFNINGKKRIWGLKDRFIFEVLWWDPEHEVYPVPLRHT